MVVWGKVSVVVKIKRVFVSVKTKSGKRPSRL